VIPRLPSLRLCRADAGRCGRLKVTVIPGCRRVQVGRAAGVVFGDGRAAAGAGGAAAGDDHQDGPGGGGRAWDLPENQQLSGSMCSGPTGPALGACGSPTSSMGPAAMPCPEGCCGGAVAGGSTGACLLVCVMA
jgi:hypothetical protein